jgi:hypothetical protein
MALKPTNSRQQAENSILDTFNRQTYLGNSYVASSGVISISSANTETAVMWINNPASNISSTAVPVGQQNIALFQGIRKLSQATNVSSATTLFKFYSNPTISANGTAITPGSLRPAMGNSSVMKAYYSQTASANGTFLAVFAINYQEVDSSLLFILDPGYSLLVTATTDTMSTSVISELSWYEI